MFPDCKVQLAVSWVLVLWGEGVGWGHGLWLGKYEAGHEQPHLPVLLLPGTTSYIVAARHPPPPSLGLARPGAMTYAGTSSLGPTGAGLAHLGTGMNPR